MRGKSQKTMSDQPYDRLLICCSPQRPQWRLGMTVLSGVEVVAESMLALSFLRWHPLHSSSTSFFLSD